MSGPQADGRHFDSVAGEYDESLPRHVVEHYLRKRTRFIVENCPRGRTLDLGCGTGALAERLAASGYAVVGADPSQRMLDVMLARAPAVEGVRASGESLPFGDGSFDLALTVATLHHVAEPEAVRSMLAEMGRVVRPGGRILIWDHNPRNPYWPIVMRRVPQDSGEERLIPLEEIVAGLESAGAVPVLVAETGLVPDFMPRAAMPVARGLERALERTPGLRRLCAHNVVLAERR